ncbi:hypothetical protein DPMN_131544 [Dreissena polymorpha]|uniref:Uncharacterized protein n=1 Tax=Dreissena polymorpha TaxID=45954 RepID=A0A9D4HD61_DREPO|nr:hypothetical protein DPMN_131544 [Dreissena polymorpha]
MSQRSLTSRDSSNERCHWGRYLLLIEHIRSSEDLFLAFMCRKPSQIQTPTPCVCFKK